METTGDVTDAAATDTDATDTIIIIATITTVADRTQSQHKKRVPRARDDDCYATNLHKIKLHAF